MCAIEDGREAPGDPTRFDPVARYDEVAEVAGADLKLQRITARGVREDGTVDLEEDGYRTEVDYHFIRSVPPPDDAPPIGAGGAEQWHQRTDVRLRGKGDVSRVTDDRGTRQVRTKGMIARTHEPEAGPAERVLPAPRCSFADLWKVAKEQGAPSGAVATIDYAIKGRADSDPRYHFSVGDRLDLMFDLDCAHREDEVSHIP